MDYDEKTALVIVDVQNDFADPSGNLYVREGEAIVEIINDEIEKAAAARGAIVYTQDWHPERTPHFEIDGGIWPVHCVQDSWGAEFHPGLKIVGDVVRKGTGGEDGYSGFSVRDPASGAQAETGLHEMLRAKGIEKVVVVGLATDYCVKETALDAIAKGFDTTVLGDAVRAVDLQPGDGTAALESIRLGGANVVDG